MTSLGSRDARVPSSASSEQEQLAHRGYVVLEGVITSGAAAEVRSTLDDVLARHQDGSAPGLGVLADSDLYTAMWPDAFQHRPEMFAVLYTDRVMSILRDHLGDPFVVTRDSAVHWDYFPGWHTDTTTTETRGEQAHLEPDWRMVTIGMYLQEGGGLEIVPGSHLERDPFVASRRAYLDGGERGPIAEWTTEGSVELPLAAGDVVIFDMRLVHRAARSTPRNSDGATCQKIAVFSRASRNVARHVEAYSDFRFNGAGACSAYPESLTEIAVRAGCLLA